MNSIFATAQKPTFSPIIGEPVKSSDLNQLADYLRKQLFIQNGNSVVFSFWGDADVVKGEMVSPAVDVFIKNSRNNNQKVAQLHFPCLNNGMSFTNVYKASEISTTISTPRPGGQPAGSLQMNTSVSRETPGNSTRKPSSTVATPVDFQWSNPSSSSFYDRFVFSFSGNPGDARIDYLPPEEI